VPLQLPPLASLRIFESAARHENFRQAAEELGLTPSAISRAMLSLEEWLGILLFEREARGVRLTEAGRSYNAYIADALQLIATGTQRLPRPTRERRVRVSVAPTLASRWLIPRLPTFRAKHPNVMVSLDTVHRPVNLSVDGADFAVRMGQAPPLNVSSEHLFSETLVPVASPRYLAAMSARGALDWTRVTLIRVNSIGLDWDAWLENSASRLPTAANYLEVDTIQLAQEAAICGLGMAIGRHPFINQDLTDGKLQTFSESPCRVSSNYWLISPQGRETRSEMIAFREWLLEEAGLMRAQAPDRCSGIPVT
jgi:DNA-binding transcriptional LysR family regulator